MLNPELASFLFVALTMVVIIPISPWWLSVASFLILVHLNTIPSNFSPTQAIAMASIIKATAAIILFVRMKALRVIKLAHGLRRPWLFLVSYALIASFWSPFPAPAVKLTGHLVIYGVLVALFLAILHNYGENAVYRAFTWSTLTVVGLTLAFYLFTSSYDRLSSFVAPQSFGLYLAFAILLTLSIPKMHTYKGVPRTILIPVLSLALFINGSRTGLAIVILGLVISSLLNIKRNGLPVAIVSVWSASTLLCIFILLVSNDAHFIGKTLTSIERAAKEHRIVQPFLAMLDPGYTMIDIGTFRFRMEMFHIALKRWTETRWLLGNGTASAGALITEGYIYYRGYNELTVDATRVIHNEFIRALYEWGIVGCLLLIWIMLVMLNKGFRVLRKSNYSWQARMAFSMVVLLFGVAFMLENVLSTAVNPLGVAVALIVAWLLNLDYRVREQLRI